MAKKPRYCWDTSVFISWFEAESRSDTPSMKAVVHEIEKKEAILVVPVIVYTELLELHHSESVLADFRRFLKRSNIQVANITMGLAEKAEQIRTRAGKEKPARKVKTPDALYLSCSLKTSVDMLHSFDTDMLKLNGSPTVEGLRICTPRTLSGSQNLC